MTPDLMIAGHRVKLTAGVRGVVLLSSDEPELDQLLANAIQSRGAGVAILDWGDCWWTDRIDRELDLERGAETLVVEEIHPALCQEWKVRELGIVGIGRGGQGAVRLALRRPDRFPVAVSLDGFFDFHELHGSGGSLDRLYERREQCRQDTAILRLNPFQAPKFLKIDCDPESPAYRGNDRLHEKLAANGVSHEWDASSDGGNLRRAVTRKAPAVAEFLALSLERAGRTLL